MSAQHAGRAGQTAERPERKSVFSNDLVERIEKTTLRYPDRKAALIPALNMIQRELGYLNRDAVRFVAKQLSVPESEVYGTASFYSLLGWQPTGRHVIHVCHNLSCSLLGAESLIEHLEKKLGVGEGEITPDGRFSYARIECIGRCDGAPAILIDDDYHGNLTPESIEQILEQYT